MKQGINGPTAESRKPVIDLENPCDLVGLLQVLLLAFDGLSACIQCNVAFVGAKYLGAALEISLQPTSSAYAYLICLTYIFVPASGSK